MGSKLLNAYIIVRINALRVTSAPVLTNTPKNTGTLFLHSQTSSTEDFVYELVILCDAILHCMLKQKIHDVMPASFTL